MTNFENPNKKQTVSRIGEKLREGVSELVIHGERRTDKEGNEILSLRPDLDSRASIYLIEQAGIDYKQLTFVPKGDWIDGSINIDTGEVDGPLIGENDTVFIDHHGSERKDRKNSTSATMMTYDILLREGFLKREKYLDNLVDFVTDVDNEDYQLGREYFINEWWKTLYGVHKLISFDSLLNIIKSGHNPHEPFSVEQASSTKVQLANRSTNTLKWVCEKQRQKVNESIEGILAAREEMKIKGIKNYDKELFGSVLVNTVRELEQGGDKKPKTLDRIPLGFTSARAVGFDSYIVWHESTNGFFITSKLNLQKVFDIVSKLVPDAKLIRGTMIVYRPEKTDLNNNHISRDDLLSELGLME